MMPPNLGQFGAARERVEFGEHALGDRISVVLIARWPKQAGTEREQRSSDHAGTIAQMVPAVAVQETDDGVPLKNRPAIDEAITQKTWEWCADRVWRQSSL